MQTERRARAVDVYLRANRPRHGAPGHDLHQSPVSIYAQAFGSTSVKLLKTGTVDSLGNLGVGYSAPHSTTFSVVFSGDAHYAQMTTTRAV